MNNSFPLLTQRPSMVSEAARAVSACLENGDWGDYLPAERELCDLLGVSRSTLRFALRRLQTDGLIQVEHGKKTRILKRGKEASGKKSAEQRTILVLTTSTDRNSLQTGAFWLDEYRQMSGKIGFVVVNEFLPQVGTRGLQEALFVLRAKYRPSLWVLVASDRRLHALLHRLEWPVVVGGSVYPDLLLPGVDVDYRATCRHAVGQLARLGHRRLGLVVAKQTLPGDDHSIQGFEEGLSAHRGGEIEGVTLRVDSRSESVFLALRREYARARPATALITCRPQVSLSVITALAALGRTVPRHVSLIARDYNASILDPVWPELASYRCDPAILARKMLSLSRKFIAGEPPEASQFFFMPEYHPGASAPLSGGGGTPFAREPVANNPAPGTGSRRLRG